jgi:transposase
MGRHQVVPSEQATWRVATRYDKLADNYLASIERASIRVWLRAHEFAPWQKQARSFRK